MISSYDTFIGMTPNYIREIFELEPLEEPNRTGTNCKNCGAPLTKNGYCEYCRTQYQKKWTK